MSAGRYEVITVVTGLAASRNRWMRLPRARERVLHMREGGPLPAVEIAFDIEEPICEANTLLQAISLMR